MSSQKTRAACAHEADPGYGFFQGGGYFDVVFQTSGE